MELVYLYLKEYENIFENIDINLSAKYKAEYDEDTHELHIKKNEDSIENYYGDNVKNVTLFLGKNGVGKTTLLDILGMKRDDRVGSPNERFNPSKSGFILYHLDGDYFAVESLGGFKFIYEIGNLDLRNMKEIEPHYKTNISFVFELKNDYLIYRRQLLLHLEEVLANRNTINYAYIATEKYSERIIEKEWEETSYTFPREYYLNNSVYEYIYKYFSSIKNLTEDNSNKQFIINRIIKADDEFTISQRQSIKDEYLCGAYSNIAYECLNYVREYYENYKNKDWDKITNEEYVYNIMENLIDFKSFEYSSYSQLKEYLKKLINTYKQVIYFRDDLDSLFLIIEQFEKIPERYFRSNKQIVIDCDAEIDESISEFFRVYDDIYNYGNIRSQYYSTLDSFEIKMPIMSEGQSAYIKIISQAISSVAKAQKGDTVIILIDEPDRAMHPEMARKFLDVFLKEVNQWEDRNIQLVMSSHSPFIATDILPEDVYIIDISDEGKRFVTNNENAFASNIYYLLKKTFMLSNVYGEYSRNVIKAIMDKLNNPQFFISDDEVLRIRKIINRIGEDALRNELEALLYKKTERFDKRKLMLRIMSTDDKVLLQEIERVLNNYDTDKSF